MEDITSLLDSTMRFVLSGIERELRLGIDWRASGRGWNVFRRAAIYAGAMARDLVRIPLHHPDGIAQARFRARIQYIERTVVPTVGFFLEHYPLSQHQRDSLSTALTELGGCIELQPDGRMRALDEWYATMEEFAVLTERCEKTADALAAAVRERSRLSGAESEKDHRHT
ncbi:MAG: hypothetical protein P8127_08220 [Acidobacteriota bacterium]